MAVFSNFVCLLRSTAGRNNTGRITVRYRARPKFLRFQLPKTFFSSRSLLSRSRSVFFRTLPKSFNFLSEGSALMRKLSPASYSLSFLPNHTVGAYASRLGYGAFVPFGVSLTRMHTIPYGSAITNLQWASNGRPLFARAAGSSAQLIKRLGSFVIVKLPSGEIRKFSALRFAIVNQLPLQVPFRPKYYKAGQTRNLGIRPHVRGCAINPVDHPHGGRTGESRPSVTPWGLLTKGKKTRTRSYSSRVVLKSVQQLKASK